MREHRTYTQNDEPPMVDGDNGFIGVDMRHSPQLLQPGYVAEAKNARFRDGVAEPRKGVMPLSFGRIQGFDWDIEWTSGDIRWDNFASQFGDVLGVGVWNDPDGQDWMLVASSTDSSTVQIYRMRPGNSPTKIPVAVTLTVPTSRFRDINTEDLYWFTQAFEKCILSRGYNNTHLVLSSFEQGFVEAPDPSGSGAGTEAIPNAKSTLFFQNRLLVPHRPTGAGKADHVAVSDILDYTSYLPTFNNFKINQGDSDNIKRLYKFNDTTVVVFKDTSIYAVSNLTGDWSENAILDQITTEYGLVGARSVANTGDDLWFLSQRGVVSLRQTELNKVQGVTLPQSAPIQPVINRIDMSTARETACGAYWRDRYYLSVPLDGSQQNNAVLVYDFLNQAWSGYDDGDAIKVKYFFVADHQGSEHLYFVDYDGVLGLYEYGELEGRPVNQSSYTCDVLLKGLPSQDATVQVNSGTLVTAARYREIIDESENVLKDQTGLDVVENLDTNVNDAESGWLWGVGVDPADYLGTPVDNLYSGYATDGWIHGADSVAQLDAGVRFSDTTPILVNVNDPYGYLQVLCTQGIEVEDRPILFMIKTRGYGFDGGNRKRFQQAQLFMSTWCPEYRVTACVDGVKEEEVLVNDASYTFPSRTKYLTFATADWPITNVNDDHETEGREDYSVILDATEPGGGTLLGASGMQLDIYQYWTHKLGVSRRGAFFQLKVEGLDGRVRIHSITSGNTPGQRRLGTHA